MKRNLLIILMLVLAVSLTACGNKTEVNQDSTPDTENVDSVDENAPEDSQDEVDTDEEDLDEIEDLEEEAELEETEDNTDDEEALTWPADFMPNVPEFQAKILKFTEKQDDVHIYIGFEDVNHEEAVDYVEELKAAGFTKDSNGYSSSGTVNYKGNDKDGNFVKFHWSQNGFAGIDIIKK